MLQYIRTNTTKALSFIYYTYTFCRSRLLNELSIAFMAIWNHQKQ